MSPPELEDAEEQRGNRPVARRVRALDDNYGVVLIAILTTLVVMGIVSERSVGHGVIPLLMLGIFFLTLATSGVPRRTIIVLTVIIPVIVALAGVAVASGADSLVGSLSLLVSTGLIIACVLVIFRRLSTHEVITRRTIFGALCVYLFGALLFALLYVIIAAISDQPFFVQTDDPSSLDYIYFSFIAMATVGFGDFTPATDVGKMVVIVEALLGQLYLVVVVALFVSRIGRRRVDRIP